MQKNLFAYLIVSAVFNYPQSIQSICNAPEAYTETYTDSENTNNLSNYNNAEIFLYSTIFRFFELSKPPATLWWTFKEIFSSQNWFSPTMNTLSTKWKKSETIDFKKVLSYSKSAYTPRRAALPCSIIIKQFPRKLNSVHFSYSFKLDTMKLSLKFFLKIIP